MVWAGSNLGSYAMAEEAILQLSGRNISAGRIRRQIEQASEARLAERDEMVDSLKAMALPLRRGGSPHRAAPQVAVTMMDGGRYQRRDHFASSEKSPSGELGDGEAKTHWRESKVGCLLSMTSQVHAQDPCPQIPDCFAAASVVREIAKMSANTGLNTPVCEEVSNDSTHEDGVLISTNESLRYKPPELESRDVVASGQSSGEFGWQLEGRAQQLNFPAADRQAFVADGAKTNWRIAREHFPHATPIADLLHALSYAWSASKIDDGETTFGKWAQLIWQGDVAEVIEHLQTLQHIHGQASDDVPSDPRRSVDRALTYFTNNADHMKYPEYREQGLPITSAHIESTVKQINRRIKGTEKFWRTETSEGVLQLRADYLSQSEPIVPFWRRYQANQSGSNAYRNTGKQLQST
jgi:hypothetical protein